MKFTPSKEEYTFAELADFVRKNRPNFIEMSEEDEHWYRNLLNPESILPSVVTFLGIPVVVSEERNA